MSSVRMIPQYDTKLFTEVWEEVNDFVYDYQHNGIPVTITPENAGVLYWLLSARYANNPIANWDDYQFKLKVFAIIFQYGPTWEKRLQIQSTLRNLTDADLEKGTEAIHNHALNPSTAPANDAYTALNYMNEQNASVYKKSKMDRYGQLWDLLATDVTGDFLNKFQKCFKQFVRPEKTWIYVTDDSEEDDE